MTSPDELGLENGVHFSFHRDEEYWYRKGGEIAEKLIFKMANGDDFYPAILPADKKSRHMSVVDALASAHLKPDVNNLIVNPREPVNNGFLKRFMVTEFIDLRESPILQGLQFEPSVSGIFRVEDYTEEEQDRLTGGVYLPAVRVDFVKFD